MIARIVPGLAAALLLAAAASLAQTPPAATPAALADGPGKDRVVAACGGCHAPEIVTGQHHDQAGWTKVMNQMIENGAMISDADFAAVTAYLAKHY